MNRVKVLVLGGGTVGEAAARMAAGMGSDVWITDISLPRLRQLEMELPINVHTLDVYKRQIVPHPSSYVFL